MSTYNMPPKDLFGKRCKIPTGMSGEPFVYRIINSEWISNYWSEIPLTYKTENNPVIHTKQEQKVLIVVLDTLIDENSKLIRVALKDVEIMDE